MKINCGFAALLTALAMCCAVNAYAAEALSAEAKLLCDAGNMTCGSKGATSKNTEPYILLEEEEVRIFDGKGKELYSVRGNRGGKRLANVRREVDKLAQKKRKPKSSFKNTKEATLDYWKTTGLYERTQRLKPESLKFIGEDNHIVKKIPIGYQVLTSSVVLMPDNISQEKASEVRFHVFREAVVSYMQTAAVIMQIEQELSSGGQAKSSLAYYGVNGELKWEKNLVDNTIPMGLKISADGTRIAYVSNCELNCHDIKPILVVLNEGGNEIWNVLLESDKWHDCGSDIWLSQNGQFLMTQCVVGDVFRSIIFNVPQKSIWEAPSSINVLMDDGGLEIIEGDTLRVESMLEGKSMGISMLDLNSLAWEKLP